MYKYHPKQAVNTPAIKMIQVHRDKMSRNYTMGYENWSSKDLKCGTYDKRISRERNNGR